MLWALLGTDLGPGTPKQRRAGSELKGWSQPDHTGSRNDLQGPTWPRSPPSVTSFHFPSPHPFQTYPQQRRVELGREEEWGKKSALDVLVKVIGESAAVHLIWRLTSAGGIWAPSWNPGESPLLLLFPHHCGHQASCPHWVLAPTNPKPAPQTPSPGWGPPATRPSWAGP